ncbi:MAG: hypothetical protein ACRC46_10290 [Thermoguttaceae bacterium]
MTTQPIIESGMQFGPYPDGYHCFHVECSNTYAAIQEHVKMVEFLLLRNNDAGESVIWIVEAKPSAPRNPSEFVTKIRDKLVNAFSLCLASRLGRHPLAEAELPDSFKTFDTARMKVQFVLVVRDFQESWLPPLQDMLNVALRPTVKTWAFGPNSVVVLNEEGARRKRLIA